MSLKERWQELASQRQEERKKIAQELPAEQQYKKAERAKEFEDIKEAVLHRFIENSGDRSKAERLTPAQEREVGEEVRAILEDALKERNKFLNRNEQDRLCSQILDEILGYGPITPFLNDESVSEVMVNGPFQIYVERGGKLEETDAAFRDDAHVMRIIEKIISPLGRRLDESSPMVDARLPDGSRVNAVIPPLTIKGPTITIRKFSRDPFMVEDLISFGTLSPEMALFLQACVVARLNILVSGGSGAGKTTTLNVLSSFIPPNERIVTIEDAAELQLRQRHVVTMESRPPNIEGKGRISIRDLVINSLRMRPDRIVVGEVRGGEALDMLQAMNTGHDGSITTLHANSPRDALARLETMVLMAGVDLPVRAIREQISSAINLVVQQSRFNDGSRKISQITEINGMEGDKITMQDIFMFEQWGQDAEGKVIGKHLPVGIIPSFMERLRARGQILPLEIFRREEDFRDRKGLR